MNLEKKKMLDGEISDALDNDLVLDRQKARNLAFKYKNIHPDAFDLKEEVMQELVNIKKPFYIEPDFNCDYGYNIEIGQNFFANFNCTILDVCKVKIGNDVLFGPNVQIYTAMHPTDPKERLKKIEFAKPVTIGNNVWLAGGVIVCPGVTIGDNTTIGAGSVVTKDIEANCLAVGNPCKVVKKF